MDIYSTSILRITITPYNIAFQYTLYKFNETTINKNDFYSKDINAYAYPESLKELESTNDIEPVSMYIINPHDNHKSMLYNWFHSLQLQYKNKIYRINNSL